MAQIRVKAEIKATVELLVEAGSKEDALKMVEKMNFDEAHQNTDIEDICSVKPIEEAVIEDTDVYTTIKNISYSANPNEFFAEELMVHTSYTQRVNKCSYEDYIELYLKDDIQEELAYKFNKDDPDGFSFDIVKTEIE